MNCLLGSHITTGLQFDGTLVCGQPRSIDDFAHVQADDSILVDVVQVLLLLLLLLACGQLILPDCPWDVAGASEVDGLSDVAALSFSSLAAVMGKSTASF